MPLKPQMIVQGRVGQEPALRFTTAGIAACSFSIAHTSRVLKNDEWTDGDTMWYRITAWRKLAENVSTSISKGDLVTVVGKPREEKWTDKDGNERVSFEVVADDVAVSLTNCEVRITRNPPKGQGNGGQAAHATVSMAEVDTDMAAPW